MNRCNVADFSRQLLESGDFLSFTREHPEQIDQAFTFYLNTQTQQTQVSVLDTGVICFEPVDKKTKRDIVLSCGVHGNETAPIEICQQLIKELLHGQLTLRQRVLFLFGNPPAINLGSRFVEENLNRLFSGAHSDDVGLVNQERRRAKALEDYIRDFFDQGGNIGDDRERLHYDLHTAIRGSKNDKFAVYPFSHGKPRNKQQLQFLNASGVNTILLSNSPTTTFSYFSVNECCAHAFTVELGKVRPFGENNPEDFSQINKTLRALLSEDTPDFGEFNITELNLFEIYKTINRTQENFTLNFADDVENFTDFPIGYVLANDGDVTHEISLPGEAIIFPNAEVALGQRALLTVIPAKLTA
ncbi:succinylglutamate desuccinylase [Thalassotalea litorea]|uniref:Succinylglutamate desuccinylase n=1 Tax=Thalassotalea litorea TaxID=2020715 RepID=A0A5R9ISJ9_9GAMM|nr:succinylglutamate desuccinylase [Thalassotalea litorea]TLU67473.1 succinylglutamate desuccinylase [Thalassotalea litorea]